MASSFIKGITVEIGGDTTGLKKSLKDVDSSLKDTQYQLNQTNKALKLDPTNTELLAQKQRLLKDAIQETTTRLNALKQAKADFDSKGDLTKEQQKQFTELANEIVFTTDKLKKLNNEASGIGTSFTDATDSALDFSDVLKANVFGDVITKGIETIVSGLEKIASSFVDIVKSGVEYNATMESYQTSFTAMLGSAEEAEKAIDNIKKNASASPFDIASLVQANQLLLTTGETAEDAEKVINALGDAVAYTGGGNDELTRMAQNLQQIKNVGKATSTDIKQFAMAGIDVYGILSDYMGVSIEQIKEMDISYEDLSNALIQASSEEGKYFGAMERQSTTLNGQLNLITSQWNELTGIIAEDTTSALTNDFLPAVNQALDSMIHWEENGFGSLGEAMASGIDDMLDVAIEKAPELLQTGLDMIKEVAEGLVKPDEETGETPLEKTLKEIITGLTKFVLKPETWKLLADIGWNMAKGIIEGFWDGLFEIFAEDPELAEAFSGSFSNIGGSGGSQGYGDGSNYQIDRLQNSLGYGNLASGGFSSGGITLNASFNMAHTQLNENSAKYLADLMADEINNKLGGMV